MKTIVIIFIVSVQLVNMQGNNDNSKLKKQLDLHQFNELLKSVDEVVGRFNQFFGLIRSVFNPIIDKIN
jgi:hypothetical protein